MHVIAHGVCEDATKAHIEHTRGERIASTKQQHCRRIKETNGKDYFTLCSWCCSTNSEIEATDGERAKMKRQPVGEMKSAEVHHITVHVCVCERGNKENLYNIFPFFMLKNNTECARTECITSKLQSLILFQHCFGEPISRVPGVKVQIVPHSHSSTHTHTRTNNNETCKPKWGFLVRKHARMHLYLPSPHTIAPAAHGMCSINHFIWLN